MKGRRKTERDRGRWEGRRESEGSSDGGERVRETHRGPERERGGRGVIWFCPTGAYV